MHIRPVASASMYSFVFGCTGAAIPGVLVMVATPAVGLAASGQHTEISASHPLLAKRPLNIWICELAMLVS